MVRFIFLISGQPFQGNSEYHCGGVSKIHILIFTLPSPSTAQMSTLEVTYDIAVYMLGGTEILNVLFRVNIYQHGGTWKLGLFSLLGVRKIIVLSTGL